MKVDMNSITLSGKGFFSEKEWLDDNIRIITSGVAFHEVVNDDDHFGWIVMGEFRIDGDFTAHSKNGLQGKSVSDRVEYAFIVDKNYNFGDFIPSELEDFPTEEAEKVLEKYKTTSHKFAGSINIDDKDQDNGLIVVSTKTNYVLVQTEDSSIRVCEGEVMVLQRDEEKLVHVSSKDGKVSIGGDRSIEIKDGTISFNGKMFNPEEMISEAMKSVSKTLGNLFNSSW